MSVYIDLFIKNLRRDVNEITPHLKRFKAKWKPRFEALKKRESELTTEQRDELRRIMGEFEKAIESRDD